MQSKATTVEQYLAELPEDRRAVIQAVREVILTNIDKDYEEGMQYGMIGYYVPHRIYPPGYHCDPKQPLPFAGLAAQKNYLSLYMMPAYGEGSDESRFRAEWAKTGKKLDMGKSCIRFKKLEDLAIDVIADTIRRTPARAWVEFYESVLKTPTQETSKSVDKQASKTSAAAPTKPTKSTTAAAKTLKTSKPQAVKKAVQVKQPVMKTAEKPTAAKKVTKKATKKIVKKAAKVIKKAVKKKTTKR